MRRTLASLTMVITMSLAARAKADIAEPRDISAFSPSRVFEARAIVGSGFGHERIVVYGPTPGALFWAASLGSTGEYVTDIHVTDQGCLLAESLDGSYRMFTSTGKAGLPVRIYDELSSPERSAFADESGRRGAAWFASHLKRDMWTEGGRSWVYLRTCWGHIFPFNCASGDLDRAPGLADRIEASLLAETRAWLASRPGTFVGACPRCHSPCLDPAVVDRLFIIRTHELAEGEPVLRAALAARTAGHDDSLKDDLDRVYDPESLAVKARHLNFRYPLIGLILVLAGAVWFTWKRAGRH